MKIKMRYIYGIILLVLLMSLAACSNSEAPIDDVEMGTPEGVILAYIQGFSNEDYTQIESMLGEYASVGDIYFTQSQQPPKSISEMIKSQHEFIIHFYGADAWMNVEYEIEDITLGNNDSTEIASDSDTETDSNMDMENEIKEYRVNLVFQDMPKHLMGYENIHIVLSNESGAWVITEGLSWDKNLYGGGPAPEYFKGSEAMYRGVSGDNQPEDIKNQLGVPIHEEENIAGGDDPSYILDYEDASYYFVSHIDEDGSLVRYYLESIIVKSGNHNLPREIKLGDTFYDTMEKFPREKDWLSDPYNCFYGINTLDGFGGACFSYEDEDGTSHDSIVLVPTEYTPYLKLEFTNGILETAMLVYIQMQ